MVTLSVFKEPYKRAGILAVFGTVVNLVDRKK